MNESIIHEDLKTFNIRFKDYLISERKLANNTVEAYTNDIHQFIDYLASLEHLDTLEHAFYLEILDDYLIRLYGLQINSRSILRKLSSISIFLKFLKIEGIINDNTAYLLNRPKTAKNLPHYLTVDEIERFINCFDLNTPNGIRDRTLFELIYSCGLRVSELSSLNVNSVDFNEALLKVFGKGSQERIVPIGERAVKELENYLTNARPYFIKKTSAPAALFLNYRGERLTRKGIWKNLKAAAVTAGLDYRYFTVHTLRHSFATHLIQNGADISSVQALLGHKNIVTTEIYTHLDLEHIKSSYRKYHSHK